MRRLRYHGKHRGNRTKVARDYMIPAGWLLRQAEHVRDDSRSLLEDFYATVVLPADPWPNGPVDAWAGALVGAA